MNFYPPEKTKIAVAMSGGVDSSVTAYLLLKKGYAVTGVTMQVMPAGELTNNTINAAKSVANQLNIEHHCVDVSKTFHEQIIKPFCDQYICGRTPNPCVYCNRLIKFSALINLAREIGADYLSTGHYVRIAHGNYCKLQKGIDPKKDQSYFLARLIQNQLSKIVTPLGDYTKDQVWQIAREAGFESEKKEESQEICFLPEGDYAGFVYRYGNGTAKPGRIVYSDGKVAGTHRGLPYYTIGQRKFLGVATGKPQYVIDIRPQDNTVVIGDDRDLLRRSVKVTGLNWIVPQIPIPGTKLKGRIRYRHNESDGEIILNTGTEVEFVFDEPQRAVTPGQQMVFYRGDEVIGAGVIDSSHN